jgi:hypothetical protein
VLNQYLRIETAGRIRQAFRGGGKFLPIWPGFRDARRAAGPPWRSS